MVENWSKTVIFGRFGVQKITGFGPVLETYIRRNGSKTLNNVTCTLWGTTVMTHFLTIFAAEKLCFLAIQNSIFCCFFDPPVLDSTEKTENRFFHFFSLFFDFFEFFEIFGNFWKKPKIPKSIALGLPRVFVYFQKYFVLLIFP